MNVSLSYNFIYRADLSTAINKLTCFVVCVAFKEGPLFVFDERYNERKHLSLYCNSLRNDLHLQTVSVNFWHGAYLAFFAYAAFCVKEEVIFED